MRTKRIWWPALLWMAVLCWPTLASAQPHQDQELLTHNIVGESDGRALDVWVTRPAQPKVRVIEFGGVSPTMANELVDDVRTLDLLCREALGPAPMKMAMGLPVSDGSDLERMYLEGFGVLLRYQVQAALAPTERAPEQEAPISRWERARRLMAQPRADLRQEFFNELRLFAQSLQHDEQAVKALTKQLEEAVRESPNVRHLKPGDKVAVVVTGARGPKGISTLSVVGHLDQGDEATGSGPARLMVRVHSSARWTPAGASTDLPLAFGTYNAGTGPGEQPGQGEESPANGTRDQ